MQSSLVLLIKRNESNLLSSNKYLLYYSQCDAIIFDPLKYFFGHLTTELFQTRFLKCVQIIS